MTTSTTQPQYDRADLSTPRRSPRMSDARALQAAGITKAAPASPALLTPEQERQVVARLEHKYTVRAFGVAVRQLPEAACRPAAAARLASLETFDPVAVMADDFDFMPQLGRVASKLRGLPVETAEASIAAPGTTAGGYCRTRRRVEVKMSMLPQTKEGHRLRHKLSHVLMAVDEGREIKSALTAAGFDPAAYA